MDSRLHGPPKKLYDLCLNVAARDYSTFKIRNKDFRNLPTTALADFYDRLFQDRCLCILAEEFSQLDIFERLLYVKGKQAFLMSCYQQIINHGTNLNYILYHKFKKCSIDKSKSESALIKLGLQMGIFLNDEGWFDSSASILNLTETIIVSGGEKLGEMELLNLLECYRLKLFAEAHNCIFLKAEETYQATKKVIKKLRNLKAVPHLARIYSTFSMYKFVICSYEESYKWSVQALKLLSNDLTKRVTIEILRQTSKSCVVKRKFSQAGFLIRQAMNLGEILYEKEQDSIYSDILMDYGFYLLNSDLIGDSVYAYQKALDLRAEMFEKNNIHVAIGHEDLAYALYVNEYSSGNFWLAKEHAEKSIQIMEKVLHPDHLLLASVNRVKALILEEIALDERSDEKKQKELLNTAEDLHITALRLSRESFGEDNIQTAKHFGNLGRLYQSMKQYDEAERMHNKAISIKEKLLGTKDYEVGLSIGHLASLYNYHMKKYKEAEKLYLRSIEINLNLFGPAYSGLEYDYRGLMNVYNKLVDPSSAVYYHNRYREWKGLRENVALQSGEVMEPLLPPKEIVRRFFDMGVEQQALQEQRAAMAKNILRGCLDGSINITNDSKDVRGGSVTEGLSTKASSIDLNYSHSSNELNSDLDEDDDVSV